MPKYIATSSSYFKPFSYDELVKPLAQMAEAQNAVADNYDKISMESEGLRRYITDNPEDSMAKELYDDYMSKLTTLQDNLWNNGYNAQARRDLSAARAGYASDITRIAQAVKSRQERSKAYWDIKSKNPDMIMGRDPGTYGLNPYLTNDNFGQDYYTYSGESFMKEVGADAAARASEMLNDPRVVKDPRLVGYLQRITRDGFTSQEVAAASDAVWAAMNGDESALAALDQPSQILADVLRSHMDSTGAIGKVDASELQRLFNYGKAGLSQAIGKTHVQDIKDLQWEEAMKWNNFVRQQQYKAAKKAASNTLATGKLQDTERETITGPDRAKVMRRTSEYDPSQKFTLFTPDGQEVHSEVDASSLVYGEAFRRQKMAEYGFDIGRTSPGRHSRESQYLQGYIEKDGVRYFTRYNPRGNGGQGSFQYSRTGDTGSWIDHPEMTEKYKRDRLTWEQNRDRYKDTDIYKKATIDPDKQYEDYQRYNVRSDIPLAEFRSEAMQAPGSSKEELTSTYIARRKGNDNGKYITNFSDIIASGLRFEGKNARKDRNWRAYRGTSDLVHKIDKYGNLERRAMKDPDDIFKFDKDNNITNIRDVQITPASIMDVYSSGLSGKGYLVCRLTDNEQKVAISIDMLNSSLIESVFKEGRRTLDEIFNDPVLTAEQKNAFANEVAAQVSAEVKYALGYITNYPSQGGTSKDEPEYDE